MKFHLGFLYGLYGELVAAVECWWCWGAAGSAARYHQDMKGIMSAG